MFWKIGDLRNKQIVCVKNGCVLGYPSDVEFSCPEGQAESLVIAGRPRFLGLFGKSEDIVIPWCDIEVIGHETVLVSSDSPYCVTK